jgi:hypothetical protein
MSQHRASWIAALAKLTTPHDAERAAASMSAYMPFLAELPEAAFTLASMRHVAMQDRRMMIPDLREVLGPLEAWWRDNAPRRTAIAAPVKPDEPEREELTAFQRSEMARQIAELADSLAPKDAQRPKIRAHVVPASVLTEARAKLRGNG